MVSVQMRTIVPVYSCAILNTEKDVTQTAGRSTEAFKPEARTFITALQPVGKGEDTCEILQRKRKQQAGTNGKIITCKCRK